MLGLLTLMEVMEVNIDGSVLCTQMRMSTSGGVYQLLCVVFQTEVAALAQEEFV